MSPIETLDSEKECTAGRRAEDGVDQVDLSPGSPSNENRHRYR